MINLMLLLARALVPAIVMLVLAGWPTTRADAKTGIINTRHNLSASGTGDFKALNETRICIFCHTPHNAAPSTPLWNKKLDPINYLLYTSSTMRATPAQPTGPSRLCLSCHDGTIALGSVLQPSTGIGMNTAGGISPGRPAYLGTLLDDDHPVSFLYYDSLPNQELAPFPPAPLQLYGNGTVHCSTCHDAHDNSNKKFLAVNNEASGLCTLCHIKDGWMASSHRTSPNTWNGLPPDPWPRTGVSSDFNWNAVSQNGCENCHTPHSAGGKKESLNFEQEENNCFPCHNGNVASKNIRFQFSKPSRHRVELYLNKHAPGESPLILTQHVECADCHNPHASNSIRTAVAPAIGGSLEMVSGVDVGGVGIVPPFFARYEYEVCFKCHADSGTLYPFIQRVINTANTRIEFDLNNPSYHPVAGIGKNSDVPSLNPPSPDLEAPLNLSASSIIYCTDCHSDETSADGGAGSRGPHGSQYAPILRRRYQTTVGAPESQQNYALCYRCHNRNSGFNSILSNESFKANALSGKGGHSGHLQSPTDNKPMPCSMCHDPHGVRDNGVSGSHTHLINFDTLIVKPAAGNSFPIYIDGGAGPVHAGNCTLECHFADNSVKVHNNASYP